MSVIEMEELGFLQLAAEGFDVDEDLQPVYIPTSAETEVHQVRGRDAADGQSSHLVSFGYTTRKTCILAIFFFCFFFCWEKKKRWAIISSWTTHNRNISCSLNRFKHTQNYTLQLIKRPCNIGVVNVSRTA